MGLQNMTIDYHAKLVNGAIDITEIASAGNMAQIINKVYTETLKDGVSDTIKFSVTVANS